MVSPGGKQTVAPLCGFCHDEDLTTHTFPDVVSAAEACGARAVQVLEDAIRERGQATLAISGGSSPKPMYAYFAKSSVDWSKVQIITMEDPHVAQYKDPPFVQRAPETKQLPQMLIDGEVNAALIGDKFPDPRFKTLVPDAEAANKNKTNTSCLTLGLIFVAPPRFSGPAQQKINPALDVRVLVLFKMQLRDMPEL